MRARFEFSSTGQPVVCAHPVELLVARRVDEVAGVMAAAERALHDGFHIAGWVAYEAAAAFDAALTTQPPGAVPLVCFGVFREMTSAAPLAPTTLADAPVWTPSLSREAHAAGIAAIREAIADGDTYQINYTFRLQSEWGADVEALYAHLAASAQAPYAALIETDEWSVLSLSPELFFERDGDRLTTKPMKGTAPRGRWPEEDRGLGEALRESAKNRAENVMIVDLCRNDVTRVCEVGSVQATSVFDVQRYPTVWQMVSTVEGRLRPETGLADIFTALFPAGSITGAPKSSSMRLIAELEHAPRGLYCGAIGHASPDGRATFNVAIRTMTVHTPTGRAEYGVGGGITWDSTAPDEHAEAMQKAACLEVRPPFSLIETLRHEDGHYVRLDEHLARMKASADYFGMSFDEEAVRSACAETPGRGRVRLELAPDGAFSVTARALDETPSAPTWALASSSVDSSNRWLFHKTTRRDVYDRHRAEHPDVFDVLLWNERRELTEFTRGNVVLELDGRLVTPARHSGLLAGVFRQVLLERAEIAEAVVTLDDLSRATRLWFINSVRGWVALPTNSRTPGP